MGIRLIFLNLINYWLVNFVEVVTRGIVHGAWKNSERLSFLPIDFGIYPILNLESYYNVKSLIEIVMATLVL